MIALALTGNPKLLVADEPTTALDVTIQAQILELMRRLQRDLGMGMIFVTHDLGVVADVCDRVCVMYAGEIVESGTVDGIFATPTHPYAAGLLRAMPQLTGDQKRLPTIPGLVPPAGQYPPGCRFAPRCDHRDDDLCVTTPPALAASRHGGQVRCCRTDELTLTGVDELGEE
jgi:oligopeptide/dipeptide ABC transporter ATP-binding protein